MGQIKKVLVIGSLGMAGHVVKNYLESVGYYEVWGIARGIKTEANNINLDVSNTIELENIVSNKSFDIVVNCIGLLNKTAENNPELAIWFNSYFPHWLESLGKKYKYKLIHISTDCVFSGKQGGYYEDSVKDGTGYYAQSKALGEVINSKDLTFRTSIIGPELKDNGIGLFHWFMNQSEEVSGYTKAFWSGVTTIELAKSIDIAIKEDITGLYHLVNNTKISKYDLLLMFNEIFKNNTIKIKSNSEYEVDKSLINSRSDFNHLVPSYKIMIEEMNNWVISNNEFYNY